MSNIGGRAASIRLGFDGLLSLPGCLLNSLNRGRVQIVEPRAIFIPLVSVAMVVCGTAFTGLGDAVAVALIVVGSGMFFIGMLLPTLTEFQIGPGGFSAKLRERDREIQATLRPDSENLLQTAIQLAGSPESGEELLERALIETYLRWPRAKLEGPTETVRGYLEKFRPPSERLSATSSGEAS